MLGAIDDILNKFTMYRVLVYGLSTVVAIGLVLAATGTISLSLGGLALSIVILIAICYGTNKLFSLLLNVPSNSESWLISALILACVLPGASTPTRALYIALAGVIAMASKYLIVLRGSHLFNPAAFGAFVMSIAGLLPAIWWLATPWMTPFTVLLGLIVLRKQRRFQLFFAFTIAALVMLLLTGSILQGFTATSVLHGAVVSWPIIFFGSIMLTEPATLPPSDRYKILLGIILGLLFTSQLHAGRFSTTPQAVLMVGNLLVFLAAPAYGALLRLKQIRKLSPDIFELSFIRPARFQFAAGQYLELTRQHAHADSRGDRRTFSIVSSPNEEDLRIAFRHYEPGSSMKKALLSLKEGSRVRAAHIDGTFTMPADTSQPLLFIAGGIGITPFHSMITSIKGQRDIILLYFSARPEDFVYRQDFTLAASHGIRTHYQIGRLEADMLKRLVPDFAERFVYLSGPNAMVRGTEHLLRQNGAKHIKTDHFTGY